MTAIVRRGAFSMEDPWAAPAGSEELNLRRATDGFTPRLPTAVTLYSDDEFLNVLFRARDDEIVATYLAHDEPLYEEDVVEVFLAPRDPRRYFEVEVNPLGTTFDVRIESPDGLRTTMREDRSWHSEGLFAAIRRTPEVAETIMRIPFTSLGETRPLPGAEWRANFFRIDRSATHGDEFSAWNPTLKIPADFHVVSAFGQLVFQ